MNLSKGWKSDGTTKSSTCRWKKFATEQCCSEPDLHLLSINLLYRDCKERKNKSLGFSGVSSQRVSQRPQIDSRERKNDVERERERSDSRRAVTVTESITPSRKQNNTRIAMITSEFTKIPSLISGTYYCVTVCSYLIFIFHSN